MGIVLALGFIRDPLHFKGFCGSQDSRPKDNALIIGSQGVAEDVENLKISGAFESLHVLFSKLWAPLG